MIASFDIGEANLAYVIGTRDKLSAMRHFNVKHKKKQSVIESCELISKILSDEDFSECKKVIIEQQMRSNVRAQRIAQHVWSWFSLMMPGLKPEFVSARMKTERGLCYRERKKSAVETVRNILKDRNDTVHLDYMSSLPKQDDVADAYMQVMVYVEKND